MGKVTIALAAAGLTHVKSDKCGGEHDVDTEHVIRLDDPDWVAAEGLPEAFQVLHEQAHPDGTLSWEQCRERGCAEAYDLLYGELP